MTRSRGHDGVSLGKILGIAGDPLGSGLVICSTERGDQGCCNECGLVRSCDPVVSIGKPPSISLNLMQRDLNPKQETHQEKKGLRITSSSRASRQQKRRSSGRSRDVDARCQSGVPVRRSSDEKISLYVIRNYGSRGWLVRMTMTATTARTFRLARLL
jgi:hypothetical protein